MNNRYLGHSDCDLIWHVVYRGQIKYFFSKGMGKMAIILWKEPKYDRNQNHTLQTKSDAAVYMGKVLLIHTEELIVLLLAEILF